MLWSCAQSALCFPGRSFFKGIKVTKAPFVFIKMLRGPEGTHAGQCPADAGDTPSFQMPHPAGVGSPRAAWGKALAEIFSPWLVSARQSHLSLGCLPFVSSTVCYWEPTLQTPSWQEVPSGAMVNNQPPAQRCASCLCLVPHCHFHRNRLPPRQRRINHSEKNRKKMDLGV